MNSSIDWAARPHSFVATIMLSATRDGQEGARTEEGRGKNVQYVGGAPTTARAYVDSTLFRARDGDIPL